jgi:hypothetical protein
MSRIHALEVARLDPKPLFVRATAGGELVNSRHLQ